jgi:hypothetical protein
MLLTKQGGKGAGTAVICCLNAYNTSSIIDILSFLTASVTLSASQSSKLKHKHTEKYLIKSYYKLKKLQVII